MKKLALTVLVGSALSLGSLSALADLASPFPATPGPVDRALSSGSSDAASPFPKTHGPLDRSVTISRLDSAFPQTYGPVDRMAPGGMSGESPFPQTYGPIDRSITIAMPSMEDPFSRDVRPGRVNA